MKGKERQRKGASADTPFPLSSRHKNLRTQGTPESSPVQADCGEKLSGPRKSCMTARHCEDLRHGTGRSDAAKCCVMTDQGFLDGAASNTYPAVYVTTNIGCPN